MTVTCNDPVHEAQRARQRKADRLRDLFVSLPPFAAMQASDRLDDLLYGTPCLICGAPIDRNGIGHDVACMGLDS